MSLFQKAVKQDAKLRLAIMGPSGSGKTYTALAVGTALANGGGVALVDTENGSASKYADQFEFDVAEMHAPFSIEKYVQSIQTAEEAGYSVLILDSLSHGWNGTGGLLDFIDEAAKRIKGNSFAAWKEGTPLYNKLIETIIQSNIHVIGTMRAKTEYILQENSKGYTTPKKVGMGAVQRDGLEYEFDVVFEMDIDNNAIVTKTRCPALTGRAISKPGADVAETLRTWLQGAPRKAEDTPALDTLDDLEPLSPEPAPPQRNGNGQAAPRQAKPQNTQQRNAQPATEDAGGDGMSDAEVDELWGSDAPEGNNGPTSIADVRNHLTGLCAKFVDKTLEAHRQSNDTASTRQHQYVVSVIDGICGQSAHRDVLHVLCGREVTGDNPEGNVLASKLLDYLPEQRPVRDEDGQSMKDENGKVIYEPNPDHNPNFVQCIRNIFDKCLEARGQQKLIEA